MRLLHDAAAFVESAYANEGSSFAVNGESNLIERLRPASFTVAFDVGANEGDWILAALSAWPRCQVHAFEVAQPTFERLALRMRQSEYCSRATLNRIGLSDTEGTQPMYYFPEHPDLTCDLKRHDAYEAQVFDAELRTGDWYCQQSGVGVIDFVKIDVEGAEYKVLRGLSSHLKEAAIHCVQFEYGAFSTQTHFLLADYYTLLGNQYWIGKVYPSYCDFEAYDWRMEDFRFANYCCVSKARPDLRDLLAG